MRLHVGGLGSHITLIELVQLFDGLHPWSAFIAIHPDTKRARGFGYINIPEDLADKALQLDGHEYRGRILKISKAQNKNEREAPRD